MGAALLWDSLLCPHAIMHLNHQLMHSKDGNRAACNTKGSVPIGASGSVPSGTEVLCPALTPEDQLTPVHQPTAHYATTAVVLGLLPLQGGGLQESPRANSSPCWKVNRHPEALGMQSAQRDFDVTESSPETLPSEDMAPHGSGWHQTPAGAWTVEFELFHCWKEYSGKVQVSFKQY